MSAWDGRPASASDQSITSDKDTRPKDGKPASDNRQPGQQTTQQQQQNCFDSSVCRVMCLPCGANTAERPQLFISYKHADWEFARRLERSLTEKGFLVWIDKFGIKSGENWRETIAEAIDNAVVLLFIVSPASVQSRYCLEEIEYAYASGKVVLPVVHKDAFSVLPSNLKLILSHTQFFDFEKNPFKSAFSDLETSIRQILERMVVTRTDFVA
eukprot:TRINITY_DN6818_c0_g1_i1.p1 TRINITY_DN6818_c0_g1~~TRINITY_DN6818_c0_g1_i1.p1  ORF type:complete len:213 (+),score=37.99 TRINITY_DN6818_c0_g1_i1:73-711(+)